MVWNNQQRPTGLLHCLKYMPTLRINPNFMVDLLRPILREILRKVKKQRRRNKKSQTRASNNGKNISKHRNVKPLCQKCGCYSHATKKCHTPSHLVDLYLKSVGRGRAAPGQKYEAHFNL